MNKHVAHGHPELLFDRAPGIEYNTVSGEVKWKCVHESCGMTFDQNLSAQIHDVMIHRNFDEEHYQRNFRCDTCEDWFEDTQELNLHQQLAHKESDKQKENNYKNDKFANVS